MLSEILGLGYIGVRTAALDEWRHFGTTVLGLQATTPASRRLAFRMDDAAQRIIVRDAANDGPEFFGWEVADADALERLAARIDAQGYRVERMPAGVLDERQVAGGVMTLDPAGNHLEFFHGGARASSPFVPGRPISGFRTGSLGMGHLVLNVERVESLLAFYRDTLGFRLSDYTTRPFRAYFFHINARHHSLALIENEHRGVHHLMIEVNALDDVGQGYDIAQLEPGRIAATLGRHSNDHMTSFYMRSPSKFLIEYGWGGRDIDPSSWRPLELLHGPSLWGHDRDWLSEDLKREARRLRMAAAAQGARAPLRVLPGHYDLGIWSDASED